MELIPPRSQDIKPRRAPYDKHGELNVTMLRKLVRHEADSGVEGFYCCGSSGEGLLLSDDERKTIAEVVLEETLSEDDVAKISKGTHTGIPKSQDYQRQEVQNMLDAYNAVLDAIKDGRGYGVSFKALQEDNANKIGRAHV